MFLGGRRDGGRGPEVWHLRYPGTRIQARRSPVSSMNSSIKLVRGKLLIITESGASRAISRSQTVSEAVTASPRVRALRTATRLRILAKAARVTTRDNRARILSTVVTVLNAFSITKLATYSTTVQITMPQRKIKIGSWMNR